VAVLVLAAALGAVGTLQFAGAFTGAFTGTASPASRVATANSPARSSGHAGAHGRSSSPAAAARSQAAAWIASQVSGNTIIACYPAMCAALQASGVIAGRLMPLRPGTADPAGADMMVTDSSVSSRLAGRYAPALIASFGAGDSRLEVRATEPGGAAAYQAALRADLAARRSAGSELLRNWRIKFTAQETAQLRAGQVDSRLLATLAALASQHPFRVAAFGDASPGAQLLFRAVTITSDGGEDGAADLAAALAVVRAQPPPYLPAHAAIVPMAAGRQGHAALSIEFAAPDPLGLLTAILAVDLQRAAAHPTAIADAFPPGWAMDQMRGTYL
jgi:hypothetical protein